MNIFNQPEMKSFQQAGMSLIELMVALTIGAILLTGMISIFINSSHSHRELEKTGQLIENGRYALNLLQDDIRHAGYFGYFFDYESAASMPDPCITSETGLESAISLPLQAYASANMTTDANISDTNTCTLLTGANLQAGSDIFILRRASTDTTAVASVLDDVAYIEANVDAFNVLTDQNIDGLLKYPSATGNTTPADIRRLVQNVYFVAPCSIGSGANGVCQGGDDTIPTLKRLELSTDGSSNVIMEIIPLVEGIEYFKVQFGLDTSPGTVNTDTGLIGDGTPDSYTSTPTLAEWTNVISVRISLLARTLRATDGYNDAKQYSLAGNNVGPFNDQFKRHVYTTEVRPMNIAGRREIPE